MRTSLLTAVAACSTLAGAPALQAQAQAQLITYGETVENTLTQQDDTMLDGSAFKGYYFAGSEGDSVTIYMASIDFNAHVIIADSSGNVLKNDDNSGGDCNAYLSYMLPVTGDYVIYANAANHGEIGRYQLTLEKGIQTPPSRHPCRGFIDPAGYLDVGTPVNGKITNKDRLLPSDTSYFKVWTVVGAAQQTLTLDVTSPDMDPSVILVGGFARVLAVDDDGGGGCNARLVFTPQENTSLRVVVLARPAKKTGSFTMTLSEGSKPIMQSPACVQPGGGRDG